MGEQNQGERWKRLCREAQQEMDSKKLMDLICEIDKEFKKQEIPKKPSSKSAPSAE